MPNSPRGSKIRNTDDQQAVEDRLDLEDGDPTAGRATLLMNGSSAGSSRVSRGSSVMNSAPMIEPEIVPTPPIRTIAMNCTDSSRLNEPGSKSAGST